MKKLFFTLSMALMSTLVFAVPAKRGLWKTVKMADGTEVRVELRGDEFCNYWQAEDGRKFVKNSNTGFFELADMDKMKANADKLRLSARRNKKILIQELSLEEIISHMSVRKKVLSYLYSLPT